MIKYISFFKFGIIALLAFIIIFTGYKVKSLFDVNLQMPDMYSENLSDLFQSYATKVTEKQSLYVAKLEQIEVVERKSTAKALGFDLPAVVLKAEVPVEYNYYLNLTAGWVFELKDSELKVYIPELTSSKPAVDLSKLNLVIDKGSILRNQEEIKRRFQRDLHGIFIDKGIANRELVREQAKKSVEGFVRTWLSERFPSEKNLNIKIYFPNEKNLESIKMQ